MFDPFLIESLDDFFTCEPKINNSLPSCEALNDVLKETVDLLLEKVAQLGSPDPELANLSLDDLINIVGDANDSDYAAHAITPKDGTQMLGDNVSTDPTFGFQIEDLLDINNEIAVRGHHDLQNPERPAQPKVDFAMGFNKQKCSYIDCMQPYNVDAVEPKQGSSKDTSDFCNLFYDINSIEDKQTWTKPNALSNFIDNMLASSAPTNLTNENNTLQGDDAFSKPSTSSVPMYESSETSSGSESDTTVSEPAITTSGSKRPLDTSNKPRAKRGKPSQEWEVINDMIMNEELDDETIKKIKNNEASRLHRVKKKRKYKDLFKRKIELEKSNSELSIKAEIMQREVDLLKRLLVTKMNSTSK